MSGPVSIGAKPRQRSRVPVGLIVTATLLTVATLAVIWLVAVPVGPVVCPAIMPPPTNCMPSYREGTAIVITAASLVIYIATVVAAFTVGRQRPATVMAGIVLLGIMLLGAWPLIGLLPGFPTSLV
ncbi:hypothetical protein [uncultured Microbacterium sp.]|uniref:hypothetical protein n=1 Tax=uncultured Microbacterium sp. TaxID=191216 RepID=UPI00260E18C1|nr:hypothetical protein [uncultured Microbacterium sp.]